MTGSKLKKVSLLILFCVNTFFILKLYVGHIVLYILFSGLGIEKLSQDELNFVIQTNIFMVLTILIRIIFMFAIKKKNNVCFVGVLFVLLFSMTLPSFYTLFSKSMLIEEQVWLQYNLMFTFPYIYLVCLIILEIVNLKISHKSKNILKYW